MSALQAQELPVIKQPSPLSIRIEPDLEADLEALVESLGKKRHGVAAAALRLGVEVLQKHPERFYDALMAAEKAKAAATLAAKEAEISAEKAAAKGKKKRGE
jgi:hypothetical protein